MSPIPGTRSRITSSPTGRLRPGMTNIRSSKPSIASTRVRTDWGSLPNPGKGGLLSPANAILLSAARLLLQVGERVTGKAVPREAVEAASDERPADRGGNRNEQLGVVDLRRRLA